MITNTDNVTAWDKEALKAAGWTLKPPYTIYCTNNNILYQIYWKAVQKGWIEDSFWRVSKLYNRDWSCLTGDCEEIKVEFQFNHPLRRLTADIFKELVRGYLTPPEFLNLSCVDKRLNAFVSKEGAAVIEHKKALKQALKLIVSLPAETGSQKNQLYTKCMCLIEDFEPAKVQEILNKLKILPMVIPALVSDDTRISLFTVLFYSYLAETDSYAPQLKGVHIAFTRFVTQYFRNKKIINKETVSPDLTLWDSFCEDEDFKKETSEIKAINCAKMANWHSVSNKSEAEKFLHRAISYLSEIKERTELMYFTSSEYPIFTGKPISEEIYKYTYDTIINTVNQICSKFDTSVIVCNNSRKRCKANQKLLRDKKIQKLRLLIDNNFEGLSEKPSDLKITELDLEVEELDLEVEELSLKCELKKNYKQVLLDKEKYDHIQKIYQEFLYFEALVFILGAQLALNPKVTLEHFKERVKAAQLKPDFFLLFIVKFAHDLVTAMRIVDMIDNPGLKLQALDTALYDYSVLNKPF